MGKEGGGGVQEYDHLTHLGVSVAQAKAKCTRVILEYPGILDCFLKKVGFISTILDCRGIFHFPGCLPGHFGANCVGFSILMLGILYHPRPHMYNPRPHMYHPRPHMYTPRPCSKWVVDTPVTMDAGLLLPLGRRVFTGPHSFPHMLAPLCRVTSRPGRTSLKTATSSHPHSLTPTLPYTHTPSHTHSLIPTLPHTQTPSHPHSLTTTLPHTHTPSQPHSLTHTHSLTPTLPFVRQR